MALGVLGKKAIAGASDVAESIGKNVGRSVKSFGGAVGGRSRTAKNVVEDVAKKTGNDALSSMMDGGMTKHMNPGRIGITGGTNYTGWAGGKTATASDALRQSGIGTSAKGVMKQIGQNLSGDGWDSAVSEMAKKGIRSAAGGAVLGAGVSGLQGGDMWDGAGRGAIAGGAIGAGVGGVRSATGTQPGGSVLESARQMGSNAGVSKSVTSLGRMAGNMRNSPVIKRR